MQERKEPKFIRFAPGDVCDGVLISIEKVMVNQKPAARYTVRLADNSEVSFIGTNQINRKLRSGDQGYRVQIICTGEDPNVKRGENCMKLFKVRVSAARAVGVVLPIPTEGDLVPEITDQDIPF
ncbi:MAG: hypothetical protein ACLQHT_13540 [Terracidiphilus sp.]